MLVSKSPIKKLTFVLIFWSGFLIAEAQQSVSIGDTQIKANAVLYLKGTGSQGLIIPVVAANGAFGEQGMVVFNSTDKKLYYHNGTTWIDASGSSFLEVDGIIGNEVSQVNSTRGGLEVTGSGTNASPLSIGLIQGTSDGQLLQWNNTAKKWELKTIANADNQDLSLTGTTLSLTNDGTPITLGALSILNSVGATQITDASVSTADLATGAVTTAIIADGTIASADLAAGSVSGGTAGIIADGTIVNADVSTTAAIAGTKISPNFGNQNIATTGNTVFNTVPYKWPSAQGAPNTFLQNDGTGVMSWAAMTVAFSTANVIPKGDGTGLTASGMYEINGHVGIGTTSPAYPLDIMTATDNYGLNHTDGTVVLSTYTGNRGVYGGSIGTQSNHPFFIYTNNGGAKLTVMNTTGNVGIGTTNPTTNLEVNGFTKLGSDNVSATSYSPAIKVRKLVGTTSATQTGCTFIYHDIVPAKVIGIQVMVEYVTATYIQPSYTRDAGYEFNWVANPGTAVQICNVSGNSGSILSKPVIILITYEE
jgi:hypothetical protein